MRVNLILKVKNITIFGMISTTQRIMGITSKIKGSFDSHHVFWDMEGCSLEECIAELERIKKEYNLRKNIYIMSDKEGSYRAFCLEPKSLREMTRIVVSTDYVDWLFIRYTIGRGKATLRLSGKEGRERNRIVHVIRAEPEIMPLKTERVIYDTGTTKEAIEIGWVKE